MVVRWGQGAMGDMGMEMVGGGVEGEGEASEEVVVSGEVSEDEAGMVGGGRIFGSFLCRVGQHGVRSLHRRDSVIDRQTIIIC